MRKVFVPATALLGLAMFLPASPAFAVSKEIIQMQTQIQALQDSLAQLQRTNSEQMGVLTHLVEQSNENITRMNQQITAMQGKMDQESNPLSGQIQSLNDSVDELKTRLGRIDTTLTSMQSQMGNVSAPPAGSGATGGASAQPQDTGAPLPAGGEAGGGAGGSNVPLSGPSGSLQQPQSLSGPKTAQAPPAEQLYQSAVRDYNGAKYDLATSEFADVVKFYPQSELSGNASFYLGEVAYRQGLYPAAIRNYDIVLEQFAGSSKAPTAQLRKGEAELAGSQHDAGVRDLRALVQRYPASPEGAQARSLLNGMGIKLSAAKPSPGRSQ